MRTQYSTFIVALGLAMVGLGLYLAPGEARRLRAPFQDRGKQTIGVVTSKSTVNRSYVGGGRRARVSSFRERTVSVSVPREANRNVTIEDLVLTRDYDALTKGSEVSITYVTGGKGPYYLLTSSVDAGFFALLGWAFNGRPASGLAIAAAIPGVCLLLLGVALLAGRRRPADSQESNLTRLA